MPILDTDIKLRESERMADTPDGGGRRTSRLILDGVAGNVFPKVARVDSVYGRVNLRKVYGHVDTANLDMYAQAHAIITDAPDNDRIHVCLFSTGSDFDSRTAARDRIESYVTAGPEGRMVLYGRQLMGQSAMQAYQRVEDILPEPGDVYCLSKEAAGVTVYQQYVRITDVTHEIRTFTDDGGEFTRRIITLKIGSTLRYEFTGPENPSRLSTVARSTLVRRTNTADAARYFGIKPLMQTATMGDLTVKVTSVYTPIVPSTQRETPVSNANLAGSTNFVATGPATPKIDRGAIIVAPGGTMALRLLTPAVPGSVVFEFSNPHETFGNKWRYADTGTGTLLHTNDAITTGGPAMSVDYAAGILYFQAPTVIKTGSNAITTSEWLIAISVVPAVEVSQTAHTKALPITLATRGTVYVETLAPIPAPGTLRIDFRALGKWYRLRDDGAGKLTGDDPSYGTGSVNYATGAVVVTLGALPDVDSSVLLSWGSPAHYVMRAGAASDAATTVQSVLQLTSLPVAPGSVVVNWTSGGVTKTATGAALALSGHATGLVDATTGALTIIYGAFLPDAGSLVSVTYNQLVASGATPVTVNGVISVGDPTNMLIGSALAPGSLSILGRVSVPSEPTVDYPVTVADDGNGKIVTLAQKIYTNGTHFVPGGQIVGTVNYATGVVSFTAGASANWSNWTGSAWAPVTGAYDFVAGNYAYAARTGAAANPTPATQTFDTVSVAPLQIDFTRTTAQSVVPGSLMFTFSGKTYIERGGTLYTDVNPTTGSGIEAGTIDYSTGLANITYWANGIAANLTVNACLTIYGLWTATEAYFRTAGSPLRPSSTFVQVTSLDGELLTASSNSGGTLTGPNAEGKVQQDMGVLQLRWGEWLAAAGNETQPWYRAANVVGTQVWKPRAVLPGTLAYNCVVLSNLPLNADILGLDPVRLPNDGGVPIYRPADVAVIHHTAAYEAGTPAPGSTISVGRANLAALWLQDAAGVKLPRTLYAVNLDAGTATIAADAVFTGYATPITAKHRIEEMVLLTDVQINGQISLAAPMLRTYPVGSFVSSALLFGDQFAHVTNVFDQVTWTGEWKDVLIGAQATAQYNDVNYPIEVLNSDALSDRWRINFTSGSAYQVISESLGVIATGTTAVDLQPVNSLTGKPYFTLRAAGWGLGWAAGNQLRFNTVSAAPPFWIARTVLPGATLAGDSFDAQLRGDVD